ncbi:uncharacterized protein OCT59_018428 [Rhizophagus irregularis]|uniref:Ciga protein n=2 Tax=Rhizophagus irregularis TaxID=588596 RepID=A0A015IGW3_RHIIW|nr:hypothetical protein RirG_245620 [Rhizophagus irregularis DAOM 197198w]UZO26184.1 hypothetical protein OCT59_018428 [Rhizophagus irregularis]
MPLDKKNHNNNYYYNNNNNNNNNNNYFQTLRFSYKRLFRTTYPLLILFTILVFFFSYKECFSNPLELKCSIEDYDIIEDSQDFPIQNEKFLTYLPHSQFHNQFIELKNAIVLAYLTNRTLIVPSILQTEHKVLSISHSPLYYLNNQLINNTNIKKDRLLCDIKYSDHCSPEYEAYDNFELINWEEIIDFSWIKNEIKIIHRGYDFSIEGLFNICNIPIKETNNTNNNNNYNITLQGLLEDNNDVYVISNDNKYYYRFFDTENSNNSYILSKYETPYLISDLRKREEKLIHVDTLFGSTRIDYRNKNVIKWRIDMLRSLKLSHPTLLDVSNNIINELGGFGNFLGAHVRTADGRFKHNLENIIDQVIEKLKKYQKISNQTINSNNIKNLSLNDCKLLNKKIIFIATDSSNPHVTLSKIFSTFSCVFTINDFDDFVNPLMKISYTFDKNTKMSKFFYPLLDLLIISNGMDVVVTYSSTFSGFAKYYHDVLVFERESLKKKINNNNITET